MYNYLSLPLAIGIILLDSISGVSLAVPVNRNSQQITIESTTLVAEGTIIETPSATAKARQSSYLGLMNAGYNANQKQDYVTALNYFQQALKIQPGDSKAIKAISKVRQISSHSFDLYMQSGYAADRLRDYTTALQSFQKALQIRPDSWYAKQAVSNVTGYLAQQPTPTTTNNTSDRNSSLNLWFMLIGIGGVSLLSAGLLFYLFKKTGNSIQEAELGDLESEESEVTLDEDNESVSAIKPNNLKQEEEVESVTSTVENQVKTEITTTNKAETSNSSVLATHENLSKLDIVPELIQDLDKSDRTLRRKAVWELAQRGDSRAMKPLVELMVEVDSQERGLILEAMTQIAGRTLKPMNQAITMSLQDDNAQVKQNAIRDLTRVYDLMSQVTKRLSQAVEDSDAEVQETAKWALNKLNQMPANSPWQTDNLNREVKSIQGDNNSEKRSTSNSNGSNTSSNEPRYPLN